MQNICNFDIFLTFLLVNLQKKSTAETAVQKLFEIYFVSASAFFAFLRAAVLFRVSASWI